MIMQVNKINKFKIKIKIIYWIKTSKFNFLLKFNLIKSNKY